MGRTVAPELVGVQRIPDVTERPASQQPRGQINTPIFPADDLKAHGRLPITPEITDTVMEVLSLLIGMGPTKPHVIKCTEDGKLIVDVEAIVADHVNVDNFPASQTVHVDNIPGVQHVAVDSVPQTNAELVDAVGNALQIITAFGAHILATNLLDPSSGLTPSIGNLPNVNAAGMMVNLPTLQVENGVFNGYYEVIRPKASTPKFLQVTHAAGSIVLPAAGAGLRNILTGLVAQWQGTGTTPTQAAPVTIQVLDGVTVVMQFLIAGTLTTANGGFVPLPIGGLVGAPNTSMTISFTDPGASNNMNLSIASYTA